MASTNKAGHEQLAQPKFLITYGTGGGTSPARLRLVSPARLHQFLVARHQVATEALNELWHPFTDTTYQERKKQHKQLALAFPYIVAGVAFDKEAATADEEGNSSGWQTLSGLVILTFKYRVIKGNAERTQASRARLQKLLLNTPLLGPSITFMCKEPGECRLYVLVAAGVMPNYARRIGTITRYLQAACPKVYRRFYGADLLADTRYPVGNDPYAWVCPRPAGGYITFPVGLAQDKARACEQEHLEELARKRASSRARR